MLLIVLVASGCIVQPQPSLLPISPDQARAMALEQFPSSVPAKVTSVELTTIGEAMQGTGAPDPTVPAWKVLLEGSFYDSRQCGPDELSPPRCPEHPTTALLVIDARSGDSWGQMPAP